jgi:hypothetical protein
VAFTEGFNGLKPCIPSTNCIMKGDSTTDWWLAVGARNFYRNAITGPRGDDGIGISVNKVELYVLKDCDSTETNSGTLRHFCKGPTWGRFGTRFGTPIWDPDLGPRFGTPIWDPILDPDLG